MNPRKYHEGDKVKAREFVDCFGVLQREIGGLEVVSVETVINEFAPHHRLKAVRIGNPLVWVEGAEAYFESEV
jgi:hypothetical protein